jgi:hypothetical protein
VLFEQRPQEAGEGDPALGVFLGRAEFEAAVYVLERARDRQRPVQGIDVLASQRP